MSRSPAAAEKLLEACPEGILVLDANWRLTYLNGEAERLSGRPRDELIGKVIWTALPALVGGFFESELRRAADTRRPAAFEHRDEVDGRYYVVFANPLAEEYLAIYYRDLTIQKWAEDAARESARKYQMLMEQASDGIIVTDPGTRCLEVNARLCSMLGYTRHELLGKHYAELIHPDDLTLQPVRLTELKEHGTVTTERRLLKKGGMVIHAEVGGALLDDGRILTLFRDITERKQAEEKLREQSMLDPLTRVLNRRGFLQHAERELGAARREGDRTLMVLFADVDNLKIINDEHGHAEGDAALLVIADILRNVVRGSDVIGRWGGDEFVILVSNGTDITLEAVTARLEGRLREANTTGRAYPLSVSVGAVSFRAKTPISLEQALADADAALYEEKRHRRSLIVRRQEGTAAD